MPAHFTFPSVIEAHDYKLQSAVSNPVEGLKIIHDNQDYLVGNLAFREGVSPHKIVNADPDSVDYQVLSRAALYLVGREIKNPLALTVGFPYTTFQRYQKAASELYEGEKDIFYESFSFGKTLKQKVSVHIDKFEAIPEILGCASTVRKSKKYGDTFFIASLGFGTFEATLASPSGINERTMLSTHGLRYASNLATRELQKTYYLEMRTEHQFDVNFQTGSIVIDRKRHDIKDIRMKAFKKYFNDVIAPAIHNRWTDDDFNVTDQLVLVGGGALYEDMVDLFREEFRDVLHVSVLDDPLNAAANGYANWSSRHATDSIVPVGIDIGNANTIVSVLNGEL